MKSTQPHASTGPRSVEGKARSSMNALKSGIYSRSLTIPGENPAELDALADEYRQRFRPAVPEQRDLVDILVRSTWTLRRLAAAEAGVWSSEIGRAKKLDAPVPLGWAFVACDQTLARLHRIVNSTQRNYRDALHELERLQSLDHRLDNRPAPASGPPDPRPETLPSDPELPPQPADPQPLTPPGEFVSSTSAAPPGGPQKALPKTPEIAFPFHKPGAICSFPTQKKKYDRCPACNSGQQIAPTPQ